MLFHFFDLFCCLTFSFWVGEDGSDERGSGVAIGAFGWGFGMDKREIVGLFLAAEKRLIVLIRLGSLEQKR